MPGRSDPTPLRENIIHYMPFKKSDILVNGHLPFIHPLACPPLASQPQYRNGQWIACSAERAPDIRSIVHDKPSVCTGRCLAGEEEIPRFNQCSFPLDCRRPVIGRMEACDKSSGKEILEIRTKHGNRGKRLSGLLEVSSGCSI